MREPFLLYGATGYTGRRLAQQAAMRGLRPVLAGRSPARLAPVAQALGCTYRAFGLHEPGRVDAALSDVGVVLNAAGPFAATARPLAEACLRTRTHYLDVGGELPVFAALQAHDGPARGRGVMLLPGVGFVVAASDALAAHVSARLPDARSLVLALSRPTLWSQGSLRTLVELWSQRVEVRSAGALVAVPGGAHLRAFDYGQGPRPSTLMRFPDVITAYATTGIPDIEVYAEVDALDRMVLEWNRCFGRLADLPLWREWWTWQTRLLPEGPSDATRARHGRVLVAEATSAGGKRVRSRLRTPEPYTFTLRAALDAVARVQADELRPGFQTPARVWGAGWVLGREDVVLEDLPG